MWMLCLFFPLARYRPEHSRPIPEGKAKVAVTTTRGGKDIEATARNLSLLERREIARPIFAFPLSFSPTPFLFPLFLRLELIQGFARQNDTIREFFCSEAVVGGTSWGWFESVVFFKGGIFYRGSSSVERGAFKDFE